MKKDLPQPITRIQMPEIPEQYAKDCLTIHVPRGKCFMQRNDKALYVYIVRTGMVNVYGLQEDGSECMLAPIEDGGIIGEMEIISEIARYSYSAIAIRDSIMIRMPALSFLRWLRSDADFCWTITRMLSNKLLVSSSQTWNQNRFKTTQRLLRHLSTLGEGRLTFTRQELADACSMSLRSMQRCVRELKDQNLIGTNHGKIEISHAQSIKIKELTEMD